MAGSRQAAEAPPLPRLTEAVTAALIGALTAALVWIRLPEQTRNTLWAEDGGFFLQERIREGPIRSLDNPYDGYLHLLPRLITAVVYPLVPLASYAVAITVVSALVTGIVGAVVYLCSSSVITWRPARIALGLLVAVTPTGPVEVLGNTANLHWILLWALPWILLVRIRSWPAAAAAGVAVLVIALTEIQSVVFLPLLLIKWREPRRAPMELALLAGGAAQILTALDAPRPERPGEAPGLLGLVRGYLINPTLGTVAGTGPRGAHLQELFGWGLPIALLAGYLALAVFVAYRGSTTQRALVVMLLAASFVIWSASVLVNHSHVDEVSGAEFVFLRYSFVTSLLLLAVVPLAANAFSRSRATIPAAAALAVLALVMLVNLVPGTNGRRWARGPAWSTSVEQAATICRTTDEVTAKVRIAPAKYPWFVSFSCSTLEKRTG